VARAKCSFRQRDVTAALRAAKAAGMQVSMIDVRIGQLVLVQSPVGATAGVEDEAAASGQ
jgi:hypothetical protein